MKTVRTYDELQRIRDELDQAAANGTLTPELLDEAVDSIDEAGYETVPSSIGMSWLWRNPQAFAATVEDPLGFFRAHLDNHYVSGVLLHGELLRLIPESSRESFMREVFVKHVPANNGWVESAINIGVSREALAEMVLEKLRRTEVDLDRNDFNFLRHAFLQYGAGRIERANSLRDFLQHAAPGEAERVTRQMQQTPGLEQAGSSIAAGLSLEEGDPWQWRFAEENTLWSVLDDDQFTEAITICARKASRLFFAGGQMSLVQKVRMRLAAEQVQRLLTLAANNLESFEGVDLREFDRLATEDQLVVASRLGGGSLDLVVHLALKVGGDYGHQLCKTEWRAQFESGHSATNYRRLWPTLNRAEDKELASYIEEKLLTRLRADGYALGQVTEGSYLDRRTKIVRRQMQVQIGSVTYVQDRYQHRYFAKAGDWVIFNPSKGRRLTPHVISVPFIPAHKDGQYA